MLLPKQIIALKKIVAKTAGRFGLTTVRIERQERGPRAIATDGRRAVMFSWDEPEAGQFPPVEGLSPKPVQKFAANVPPNVLADAGRGVAKRLPNPVLGHLLLDESDTSMVKVAATASDNVTRAQAKADYAPFPDCDDVIPAPNRNGNVYDPARHGAAAFTHTRIGVNAKQFAETIRVVSDLAADDANNTVVMTVPVEPNRPIRLDARCAGRRAVAAVMPVHAKFDEYDDPAGHEKPVHVPRQIARPVPAPASTSTVSIGPPTPAATVSPRPTASPVRRRRTRKPPIEFAESTPPAVVPGNAGPR
jgi:hypothetical protein